jgi:hypothetical protein
LAAELKELPASVKIGSPQPGKTYYYRVVAENESTTKEGAPATGEIRSYALPVVSTGEAQNIVQTTATLSGTVNPEGAETKCYFAYIDQAGYEKAEKGDAEEKARAGGDPYSEGETTSPLKVTEAGGVVYTGAEPQTIPPTPISGLRPGKSYRYALVAISAVGKQIGPPGAFATSPGTPPLVSTGDASGVSQNAATLSGTVGTNSLQTEYGFEIATELGNYGGGLGGGWGPPTGLGSTIGCGPGVLLQRMLAAGGTAAGLDHSPDMLALCMARNKEAVAGERLQLKLGDAAEIPWTQESFTAAVAANMFFFLYDPAKALRELHRVLTPGGRLVVATVA